MVWEDRLHLRQHGPRSVWKLFAAFLDRRAFANPLGRIALLIELSTANHCKDVA
ncbi:hypothetical protein XVE_0006 [Xanthomonas vesicatoria ATCC 35937]|uniref:Uncharacterized protein n=1 Tax=Xanthomonas vesicatoria ATCC 35937 TaxID=925775 RepID=F0B7G3_9XANT|nr:hypothetical protein XVE_0006 [Xanthomonas vesicatoria ATCC 35937]